MKKELFTVSDRIEDIEDSLNNQTTIINEQ